MINVFQPSLGEEELEAVKKVFQSNWIGRGALTLEFERLLALRLSVDIAHLCTIGCCTEGIFQSMDLLGIQPGDEVILPTISFIAAGNAIAYRGALPVFCDVDSRTLNATAEDIKEKVTDKTRAIMLLHYGGLPCDVDEIMALAQEKNLYLIEDNACSPFSRYKSRCCGTCGDIGLWSFDSMKILVTGDGGLLYVKDKEKALHAKELVYLGLKQTSGYSSKVDNRWWEFDVSCFGRRSIMNDISSAIGIEQLKKIDDFLRRRQYVHEYYMSQLADIDWLTLPPPFPDCVQSSYYLFWIQLRNEEKRDNLARFMREKGIYTTFRYYPLHWVPFFKQNVVLPKAEDAAHRTLCLPIHQSLSEKDVEHIVSVIKQFK